MKNSATHAAKSSVSAPSFNPPCALSPFFADMQSDESESNVPGATLNAHSHSALHFLGDALHTIFQSRHHGKTL